MADVTGFGGGVTLTNIGIQVAIQSWSVSHTVDQVKSEPAFGSRMRTTDLGAGEITGSCSFKVQYDAGTTMPWTTAIFASSQPTDWDGLKGTIRLTAKALTYLEFSGAIYNVAMDRSHPGTLTGTFDFANTADDFEPTWNEG